MNRESRFSGVVTALIVFGLALSPHSFATSACQHNKVCEEQARNVFYQFNKLLVDALGVDKAHKNPQYTGFYDSLFDESSGIKFDQFPPGSKEMFREIIPKYFIERLIQKHDPLSLAALAARMTALISKNDDASREKALVLALSECDPLMQKIFQQFKSKQEDNYLARAIAAVQHDLPAMSANEVLSIVKKDYPEANIRILSPLGVGTIGQANLAVYVDPKGNEQELVIKVPKPGIRASVQAGSNNLKRAVREVVKENPKLKESEAGLLSFLDRVTAGVLEETYPEIEMKNLEEIRADGSYRTKRLTVVESASIQRKDGKPVTHPHAVIMKRAKGVPLAKRLKELASKEALTDEEFEELSQIRRSIADFIRWQNRNILQNKVVQLDPHAGNFMWEYQPGTQSNRPKSRLLTVIDVGSASAPADNPEEHNKATKMGMHMFVTMATNNAQHMRNFYEELMADKPQVLAHLDDLQRDLQFVLNNRDLGLDDKRREFLKVLARYARDKTPDFFPESMQKISRASIITTDLLEEVDHSLGKSDHLQKVPHKKKTQTAISAHAIWDTGNILNLLPWHHASMWTNRSVRLLFWDFLNNPRMFTTDGLVFLAQMLGLSPETVADIKSGRVYGKSLYRLFAGAMWSIISYQKQAFPGLAQACQATIEATSNLWTLPQNIADAILFYEIESGAARDSQEKQKFSDIPPWIRIHRRDRVSLLPPSIFFSEGNSWPSQIPSYRPRPGGNPHHSIDSWVPEEEDILEFIEAIH